MEYLLSFFILDGTLILNNPFFGGSNLVVNIVADAFCLFSAEAHSVLDASSLTNFALDCNNSERECVRKETS